VTDTAAPPSGRRRIEYLRLDALVADPRNPKAHALDDIAASMRRWGYTSPIELDERTGRIVAGHGRAETAAGLLAAGKEPPEGVDVDPHDGMWLVPVVRGWASSDDTEAGAYLAAANRLTEKGGWLADPLAGLLSDVAASGPDALLGTGYDQADLDAMLAGLGSAPEPGPEPEAGPPPEATRTLAERFLVPPFSLLDARQGYWQTRKRAWLSLGIRSELGRGETGETADGQTGRLTFATGVERTDDTSLRILGRGAKRASPGGSPRPATRVGDDGKTVRGDGAGRPVHTTPGGGAGARSVWLGSNADGSRAPSPGAVNDASRRAADQRSNLTDAPPLPEWARNGTEHMASGTSIFDPVLCEVGYRWFSPPGGRVLDPFAGGSVRGVVASLLGRAYTGVDLSAPQVEANRAQAAELCRRTLDGDPAPMPEWHVGDSRRLGDLLADEAPYDLLLTCPPYFDLEVYSDDPADLSQAGSCAEFVDGLAEVLEAAVARLADDRFAVIVMGEARDRAGALHGLIPGTVEAAWRAGLSYHNEAILVTMVGSLPLRVGKAFTTSRKVGRTHQSVLVFVKGDARAAAEACGPVEVVDPAEMFGAPA
jgi:hypothetical protein